MANIGYKNYSKYYREFNCAVCGKKAIDMSPTGTRKYCSVSCAEKAFRISKGIGTSGFTTPSCIHNDAVECQIHKCSTCGWNPRVEAKRKEALGYG